jgi:hypothetical protein
MSNKQDPKNKKGQTSERRLLTLNELSRVTGGVTAPSTSSGHVHPYNSSKKP